MNVRGSQALDASRTAVFAAICDPDALLAVIPGCREVEKVGEAEYRARISLRLPGIVGTYRTVVRLVEAQAPSFGRLEGELDGTLGTIKGQATFQLAETGAGVGTTIYYEGQGVVGGPLARLDARFVEGLAGSLIAQGLRNLDLRLGDPAAGAAPGRRRPARGTPA